MQCVSCHDELDFMGMPFHARPVDDEQAEIETECVNCKQHYSAFVASTTFTPVRATMCTSCHHPLTPTPDSVRIGPLTTADVIEVAFACEQCGEWHHRHISMSAFDRRYIPLPRTDAKEPTS